MKKNQKMTLMQHFAELRRRFLWSFLIFGIAFVVGWYVAPIVQKVLTMPLLNVWKNAEMLYTGITDGLMIRLSLAFVVALIVVIPVVFWHLWAFIEPGLHKNEKNIIWPLLIMSPILFVVGACFAFFILFPSVFGFFMELNQVDSLPVAVMPAVRDYLSFTIGMLKIFGIAFQLPLIMILLNRIGILKRDAVKSMRRYAIVFIVIIAAILTPPDVVSQILLALPMWGLFELGLLFMHE